MDSTPNKLSAVILSAVVMTVLFSLPLISLINIFCCAGIMLGGFIGVTYYSKQVQRSNLILYTKDAVFIGLLSGIISAIVCTGINLVITLFSKENPIALMLEASSQFGKELPAESMQYLEKLSEEFSRYGYSPTLSVIMLVSCMILFPLFGMFGSMIAFQIYKRKNLQNPNLPNL
jgi:hypothetical protein